MEKKRISLEDISKDCNVKIYDAKEESNNFEFKLGDVVTFLLDDEEYTTRVIEIDLDGVKMEPIVE